MLHRFGIALATAGLGLWMTALPAAAATAGTTHESSSASTSDTSSPQSEPPGSCEIWEWNRIKLGDDGVFYKCEFVDSGLYWIPLEAI
jgi:hypothetical protein